MNPLGLVIWFSFFENRAKLKYVRSEIFSPLHTMLKNYHFVSNVISSWWEGGHFAQSFPMSEIELKNVLSIMAMQFTSTHCITTQCKNLGQVIASKIINLLTVVSFLIEVLYLNNLTQICSLKTD